MSRVKNGSFAIEKEWCYLKLSKKQVESLLAALKSRFEKNMNRHQGIIWSDVESRLDSNPEKLLTLHEMERTGGEPDVIGQDQKSEENQKSEEIVFCDCSAESPVGRRSLCYDQAALESRKENHPEGSVTDMAASVGIELLTEQEYRALQKLGCFDA